MPGGVGQPGAVGEKVRENQGLPRVREAQPVLPGCGGAVAVLAARRGTPPYFHFASHRVSQESLETQDPQGLQAPQ